MTVCGYEAQRARDRLREAQADQILVRNKAMSVQTLSTRHGLDAEKERQLVRQMEQ